MGSKPKVSQAGYKSWTNEALAIGLALLAVMLFLSLITYSPKDATFNTASSQQGTANLIGVVGANLSNLFLEIFGLAAFTIPVLLLYIAWQQWRTEHYGINKRRAIGATLFLLTFAGFLALFPKLNLTTLEHAATNGGMLGYWLEGALASALNLIGAAIVLTFALAMTVLLTLEISVTGLVARLRGAGEARAADGETSGVLTQLRDWWAERAARRQAEAEEQRLRRAEEQRRREAEDLERQREMEIQQRLLEEKRKHKVEEAKRLKEESLPPMSEPVIVKRANREAEAQRNLSPESAPPNAQEAAAETSAEPRKMAASATSSAPASRNDSALPQGEEPATEPLPPVAGKDEAALLSPEDEAADDDFPPAKPSPRNQAAEALRAYKARAEESKNGNGNSRKSVTGDPTLDPEVAEMTRTAYIDRTITPLDPDEPISRDVAKPRKAMAKPSPTNYALPSTVLLEIPIGPHEQAEEELRERAVTLAEKCKEFSVTGQIHRINPGPVVTTFEFKPDPGIKYSRVVGLAEDLCLALKAESIRIDRIPGKSTVGIEVPNLHREKILLREVIESPKFKNSASKLTIALGKTINGDEYIADLARMPHLLIAGATGAGKSVTMNALICSILYKASPEEVKFIMVDPKRVELGLYENIPHLLTPIVTDPKRAANALKWAVNEMENRYKELAKYGVRNIEQYNHQVNDLRQSPFAEENPATPKPLPYIVIAIDELADLMMVARSEVETSIARLAQMARAVGIHLVLATQRPSVDIITGVIKANIPSRMSFRVSSKVDSRTIIDANGAEALLGQGDMLFLPPGTSRLVRVHGSFVNENEVNKIAEYVKEQARPAFNDSVTMSEQEAEGLSGDVGERDELYEKALAEVIELGRASTSVLQRRLQIGYGRAAKILDMMEREGFIGPADGARPRKVLDAAFEFYDRVKQQVEDPDFD